MADDRQFPLSILPKDWDKPSPENDRRCALFARGTRRDGEIPLPYRFFMPSGTGTVPLIVYLHGADANGSDNELPLSMHDVGTMFARDTWQKKHPCYILAPQCGSGLHWSMPPVRECLQKLTEYFVSGNPRIDRKQIYIYGYSAGAVGLLELLKDVPDYYAAAVAICGATGPRRMERLRETPLWLLHAADDRIVKASYGEGETAVLNYLGSRNIYEMLKPQRGRELKYTELTPGFMEKVYGVNPHCSWVAMSDPGNTRYAEWLFVHT